MVDFRRLIPALAVLALLVVGLVPAANAQAPFSCLASAVPTALRSQGLTELTGDIVLDCTGGVNIGEGTVPTANIQVYLNTTVTSRLLSGNVSEALLLIDDPAEGAQNLSNTFQGTVSGNSVQFLGVPINPPGTPGTHRIFRITNVRANASAIAQNSNVYALVIATGSTSLPIQNSPQLLVGNVQNGLTFSLLDVDDSTAASGPFSIKQCEGADGVFANVLRFTEPSGFASSFKVQGSLVTEVPQNVPGAIYNTESGLTTTFVPGAGSADTGTRLKAVFANVPAGVSIYVTTTNIFPGSEATSAHAIAGEIGSAGALAASDTFDGYDVVNVPVVSGAATAVWEVDDADPLTAQNYDFGVFYVSTADPANNLPGVGAATVLGSFAPTPPAFDATNGASAQTSSGYPIPRFAVTTASPIPVLSVAVCSTNLLFPFVTNTNGFDTGLAIANTSMDPFGTGNQAGTCTWNFYGDNAPAAITGSSVASGTVTTSLASAVAPNFQGYVIAVCNFQYGHGFAFVSDIGARNIAMGYLALIIPTPRAASDMLDN